jgi:ssDNA-binding Zn-finger/Zn-ribbon topoisomerase 1
MCGDLMMGREEGCRVIKRNGVEYVAHVEYGPCSICNKEQDKRISREISALIRKERAKTTGNTRSTKRRKVIKE